MTVGEKAVWGKPVKEYQQDRHLVLCKSCCSNGYWHKCTAVL